MTDREVKTALSALTDGAAAQAGPMKEQVLGNIARKERQRKQARRRFFATAAAAVVDLPVCLVAGAVAAIPAVARERLGLVLPGETVFYFTKDREDQTDGTGSWSGS